MLSIRNRRTLRRAVMALALVVLLLAILAGVWPSDIKRSRALRLGMTRADVEAVMGEPDGSWGVGQPPPGGVMGGGGSGNWPTNGMSLGKAIAMKMRVLRWMGVNPKVQYDDWPVRVRFGDDDHVDMIKRQGETRVEAPSVTNADG